MPRAKKILGVDEVAVLPPAAPQISAEELAKNPEKEVFRAKEIFGYAQGIAVLKIEDYENPVNHLMYKRLHLADGTTQVLSEAEMASKELNLFSLVK